MNKFQCEIDGDFKIYPQLAYGLGWALFFDEIEVQFGYLLIAISTVGVASISWSLIIGGNNDLAITINVINTALAYGELRKKTHKNDFFFFINQH